MALRHFSIFMTLNAVLSLASGCSPSPVKVEPGVSWTLARQRKQAYSNIRYDLAFTIPRAKGERVRGQETITYTAASAGRPLILDFHQPPESVLSVQARGGALKYEVINEHLIIPEAAPRAGENAVSITFIAGDDALNREEGYLYTLFVPDRASTAFPCFNQPNLKARFRLTLDVPASWSAVANGAEQQAQEQGDRARIRFTETRPMSTYLFAFAAGEFQAEQAARNGRQMRMLHRETDSQKVARNLAAIFDQHASALKWLEDYTDIPYPFDKFDFVLIPGFQFSGMEHPGAIFYRDSGLLLDETATQRQKLSRASLIAHETAHMWFGNLVTMNWFDDVWTKEVFANFMAAKIVNPIFPEIDHNLRFFLAHYPAAYDVDRSAGANAIHQQLDNLNDAGSLYGAIIYQKAPIVMRQLERLTGEAAFRDGMREYLDKFQYGNATWNDLIAILDPRVPESLAEWSRSWIEEAGRPSITPSLESNPDGSIRSLSFAQSDPANRGRSWYQRLEVLYSRSGRVRTFPLQLSGHSVSIDAAAGLPRPDFVLVDPKGDGYGLFELDPASREFLFTRLPEIKDPLTRAVGWVTLWDAMLQGQIEPGVLMGLAGKSLPRETSELIVQRIADDLATIYWRFIPAAQRAQRSADLEGLLWTRVKRAPSTSLKSTYFKAFASVALTEHGCGRLERIWRREESVAGLVFSEQDEMSMALGLAVRERPGWSEILQTQLDRIRDPDRKAQFAFVMPALSADPAVRDALFTSLLDVRNRLHEPWVLEALSYLHHPLRAASSEKFIRPSLDLLEELRKTGGIFFPKNWLDATLNGHGSRAAADIVRSFLAEHPDYPARLKGKVLQSADILFRIAARPRRQADAR